jgi:hypothetical protein
LLIQSAFRRRGGPAEVRAHRIQGDPQQPAGAEQDVLADRAVALVLSVHFDQVHRGGIDRHGLVQAGCALRCRPVLDVVEQCGQFHGAAAGHRSPFLASKKPRWVPRPRDDRS